MRMRIIIGQMSVRTEMTGIEKRVRAAGHTVADLLRRAQVNRSQWERWKVGQDPQLATWTRVLNAAQELAGEKRPPKASPTPVAEVAGT